MLEEQQVCGPLLYAFSKQMDLCFWKNLVDDILDSQYTLSRALAHLKALQGYSRGSSSAAGGR